MAGKFLFKTISVLIVLGIFFCWHIGFAGDLENKDSGKKPKKLNLPKPANKLKKPENQSFYLLCGTYTKASSKGIQEYIFDSKNGKLDFVRTIEMSNPSYLCLSKDQKFVYAVSEDDNKEGTVKAFSFDSHSGQLKFIDSQPSGGISPCYVSVTDDNSRLFVANYSSGTIAAFKLKKNGGFEKNQTQVIRDTGNGPNKERQEGPHAHSAVISPDQDYLFTADLGTDKEMIFQIQKEKSISSLILKPSMPAFMQLMPGSGPRHLIFHPNSKYAYLIQELSATITVFGYTSGKLNPIQTAKLQATNKLGKVGAADIHISSDGKFIYASNRGDANDLSIFSVAADGKLKLIGAVASGGKTPRNFSIDPTGSYLLAANQGTNNISVFNRDKTTGLLKISANGVTIGSPVFLKFADKK